MDDHAAAAEHPLKGVRLGKEQRAILRNAGYPGEPVGLELDAPDSSVRQVEARAAAKLEQLALVESKTLRVVTRARDPRRERLIFRDGGFWRRADASRIHRVGRKVVWLTPFGYRILSAYRNQIENGDRIRWDPEVVKAIWRETCDPPDLHHYEVDIEAREAAMLEDARRNENHDLRPALPDDVVEPQDQQRWRGAISIARSQSPARSDPSELWKTACRIYRETNRATLEAAALEPLADQRRMTRTDHHLQRPDRSGVRPLPYEYVVRF